LEIRAFVLDLSPKKNLPLAGEEKEEKREFFDLNYNFGFDGSL
jgi:hypothetical protein